MTLNKSFFERETNITAKVVCDSISEQGVRLTTFEIEYPRFIHSELMTHRMLSKNSSSSRAIPIQKMNEQIGKNMAFPLHWGSAKAGMQAGEEIEDDFGVGWVTWTEAMHQSVRSSNEMFNLGYHKQIANRLTEPFQMMKVVITGTDWDNFFNLRVHPDAQPEICMLAYKMYEAMQESKPFKLKSGEYHLPYLVTTRDNNGAIMYADSCKETHYVEYSLEQAIKISAASCASVSYRTEGMTLEKADKIFDMLIKAEVVHSSPLEHCATPVKPKFNELGLVRVNCAEPQSWEGGVTHMNKQGQLCSGNLRGWIQYRHLLPNNTNYAFDFDKRMELFSD